MSLSLPPQAGNRRPRRGRRIARDFEADVHKLLTTANEHPRLRPYQIEANAGIETAIAERKRQMLVAMATGCGKTFTTVNQAYRLMKSGVARRVLFHSLSSK